MVKGELCIGVFALREIQLGEEITIDYKFERYGEKPMRCFAKPPRVADGLAVRKPRERRRSTPTIPKATTREKIHLEDETLGDVGVRRRPNRERRKGSPSTTRTREGWILQTL